MQAGFEIRTPWLTPFPKLAHSLEMMFKATHRGMGKAVFASLKEYSAAFPFIMHIHAYHFMFVLCAAVGKYYRFKFYSFAFN
jgi:hypothetical protein